MEGKKFLNFVNLENSIGVKGKSVKSSYIYM